MAAQLKPQAPAPLSIPLAPEGDEGGELLSMIEGATDAELHVHAHPTGQGNGRESWCFACAPTDYTWTGLLERIKGDPDLGPGLYSIRAKRGGQWVGRKVVQIAGRSRTAAAPAAAPAAPAPDMMGAFREFQMQQMQQMQSLLLSLVGKMGGGGGGGASIVEVIQAAKMLAGEKPDPLADVERLVKIKSLLSGETPADMAGGGGDDWLSAAIKTFGPAIASTVTAPDPAPIATAPKLAAVAPPVRPAAAPQVPPPVAPPAPKPAAVPANPLRPLVSLMLRAAANDSPPEAYGVVVLDAIGDAQAAALLALPNALELLLKADPRALQYRAWFASVIEAARAALDGGDDEAQAGGLTAGESAADGAPDDARPLPADVPLAGPGSVDGT